jgi:hypothetical protein
MISHDHRTTFGKFLKERFQRGYDYGMVRPRLEHWSAARTLFYVLAAPLTLAMMLIRAFRFAAASENLGMFLRCMPIIFLGFAARQTGEAAAHWTILWRRS